MSLKDLLELDLKVQKALSAAKERERAELKHKMVSLAEESGFSMNELFGGRGAAKGKSTGVLVYELLGLKDEVNPSREQLVDVYTRALNCYRQQDWTRALELFARVRLPARCLAVLPKRRAFPPLQCWSS